jgi:DNA-binding transcriptional regulator GbsR (MarR family)
MDAHTARFAERTGQLLEADGFPPIAGRIFGLLLLRDDSCSLDEVAHALRVSKASVSTNARLLASQGVIERVTRAGDRRDYYHVAPDLFSRMMTQRLTRWRSFTDAVGEARRSVPRHGAAVRKRLAEYEAAYLYMSGAIETALARWPARQHGAHGAHAAGHR